MRWVYLFFLSCCIFGNFGLAYASEAVSWDLTSAGVVDIPTDVITELQGAGTDCRWGVYAGAYPATSTSVVGSQGLCSNFETVDLSPFVSSDGQYWFHASHNSLPIDHAYYFNFVRAGGLFYGPSDAPSVTFTAPTTSEQYIYPSGTTTAQFTVVADITETWPAIAFEVYTENFEVVDSFLVAFDSPGVVTYTGYFYNLTASTSYRLQARLSSGFGGNLVNTPSDSLWIHMGTSSPGFTGWGLLNQKTISTVWEENGCNDIGITDVFKGVKCAFIWAFYPSPDSIENIRVAGARILTIYPIGYGTLLVDAFTSATSSVATTSLDVDYDLAASPLGVGGTVRVVNFSAFADGVNSDWFEPVSNSIVWLIYLAFIFWLVVHLLNFKL